MRLLWALQTITLLVAVSYLTLGIFAPAEAGSHWFLYAVVVFVLTLADIAADHRCRR